MKWLNGTMTPSLKPRNRDSYSLGFDGHEDDFTAHVRSPWEMNIELQKRKKSKEKLRLTPLLAIKASNSSLKLKLQAPMKVVNTDINIANLISIRQLGSAVRLGLILYNDQNLGLLDLINKITKWPQKETHKFTASLITHMHKMGKNLSIQAFKSHCTMCGT